MFDDDDRFDSSNYRAQEIEDNAFLNQLDIERSYVGTEKAQVVVVVDPAFQIYSDDQDNWAGSPEQAWA